MAFCVNCGQRLPEGVKFCTNCGHPVAPYKKSETGRRTVYDGEIHKCPNCGEIIDSFVTVCPSCNYEIRGSKAAVSLQQFYWDLSKAKTINEKTFMIMNYPIPNSKEDIIEFMILASTNISGESDKNLFEAWTAKFEQAYQKSQLTLKDDPSFAQIEEIYDKTQKSISKGKIFHTTNTAGNLISRFFKSMPNPFIALLFIWLLFVVISAMVRESYILLIIGAATFIAYLIYKKFNNDKNNES